MTKKIIAFLLAALMLTALIGCNNSKNGGGNRFDGGE